MSSPFVEPDVLAAPQAPAAATPNGPLRVLVVEDDANAREPIAAAIRALGYACAEACDGDDAWRRIQTTPPDIVVSDWHMPNCDGLELCRRIRAAAIDEGPYTYFVLVTGLGGGRGFLEGMQAGADDYQTKPLDLDELQARLVSATRVVHLHRRVTAKTATLRRDSQTALRAAQTDPLTHLSNRLALDRDLERAWSERQRYNHRFAAAMCDLDDFKKYNDTCGHLAGDEALRHVAQAMRDALRESDVVYRYGGEEFLVLLPEQSVPEAAAAMDRVRRAVSELGVRRPTGEHLTISIGVAELAVGASIAQWIDRADRALYRAKTSGKDRVVVSTLDASTSAPRYVDASSLSARDVPPP